MANIDLINKYQLFLNASFKNKEAGSVDQNGVWNRADKAHMENFFVFIENENGQFEHRTLDRHMEQLEKLSDSDYIKSMNTLILSNKIFFYDNNTLTENQYNILEVRATEISFDENNVINPLDITKDYPTLEDRNKFFHYKGSVNHEMNAFAQKYFEANAENRLAEIKNPNLLKEKADKRVKEKEIETANRLGRTKESYDALLKELKQLSTGKFFDKYDYESREDFYCMDKDENGTYIKVPLASYIENAEALPLEQYEQKMRHLVEQRNIMVYEQGSIMPTTWGIKESSLELIAVTRASSRLYELENASEEENMAFLYQTDMTAITDNTVKTDKNFKILPENEIKDKIENYDYDKSSDLPPREKMPWYLKIDFIKNIAIKVSKTAKQTYDRINSVNEAHDKRKAFGDYMRSTKQSIVDKAYKEAAKIVENQNELKQAQVEMQKGLDSDEMSVRSYSNVITQQAESLEKAGWRINTLLGENIDTKGFKNYKLNTENVPKNKKVEIAPESNDKFTSKNQAFYNFAKLLTTGYAPQEGGEAQKAIQSILPKDTDIKSAPQPLLQDS